MSTTETALTCHLVMVGGHPGDAFRLHTAEEPREHHSIGHVSLPAETSPDVCRLASDLVV